MLDSFAPSEGAAPARARLQSDAPHLSLDGQWRFRLSPTADTPVDFVADAATSQGWDAITVPGHWQFQGENALTPDAAWGRPAYTNVRYPFPVDPPFVPDDNPTGDHVLEFELPADWPAGETLLRFDGVDNHVRVWVNGTEVGWSTGSRLQTEFAVGPLLRPGPNTLAVRVHQWSASSYLEDQDMWWVSGIFRSVTLLARPSGGIDDVFVHATGSGELRVETVAGARLSVPELGLTDVDAAQTFQLDVEPWTAETPRLYEATVSTDAETVSLRIGFRTVSTEGGVLTVNGAPIVFRGVNRHEWDPSHGRAVPAEVMLEDVRLMKRLGVNAVRTSHYPPHPDFLDLCDEHGLYVVLECDLETHGFFFADWRHNPSDDPRWQDAYLDRMSRTLERDKNHASVVMWSLGNEAGVGQNLHAMADLVHARDTSRPVHYEGDWDSTYVDVYSRMYAPHDEVNSIGQGIEGVTSDPAADAHRRTLPFVLCEYVHAMGNGPGGVVEYQRLIDTYPRLAGGFVWEWLDQAIKAPHPKGGTYWAYGGDMVEPLHDGDFICDGLLFPDRTLSPGALEFQAAASPVLVEVHGATVTVMNRYDHVGLDDLRFEVVVNDGDVHELDLLPVLPHASTTVTVPDAGPADVVTVRAVTRGATALVPAGHEVAFGQSVPEPAAFAWTAERPAESAPDETWFDPTTGRLLRIGDVEVEGPQLDLWRAPTDNDNGEHGVNVSQQWRSVGLDRLQHRVVSTERTDAAFTVVVRSAPAAADCGFTTSYRWSTVEGGLQLLAEFEPWGTWPCVLPRLGLRMSLPADVDRVEWYGDGPGEAYADTRAAVRLGAWTSSVADLQTPYVFPQENGARSNVRRATLSGPTAAVAVDSATGFQLTVRPWTSEDLDAARHAVDLTPRERVYVNLDVGQNGVGTAACGPGVLPGHQLWAGTALLALTFRETSA